jgi:glycosyltransferase involved in cell wall biosynthesis
VTTTDDRWGAGVLVVAEQLRRAVPGGIGAAGRGLLMGLAALDRARRPGIALYVSRARVRPDPLTALGYDLVTSRLSSRVLTRAWDHALVRAPAGFGVVHTLSLAVPPTRHVPVVVTVHDLAWRRFPEAYPARGRRWHEAALGRALHRGSHFVVPAEDVGRELVAAGAPEAAVSVVPLGSDHLPGPDDEGAAALLDRLGVRGEFLLSVGTLEPRKNLERLFRAYAEARTSLPEPWPLVVVGPTGWGDDVPGRDGVVPAGAVPGAVLAALYRRARLLAYVPLGEGFGLPPVEAMRAGTPVVASPVPSIGGAAVEVDPVDVGGIAHALVQVATDQSLRDRLVSDGRARADRLTWKASADAVVGVWRSLP